MRQIAQLASADFVPGCMLPSSSPCSPSRRWIPHSKPAFSYTGEGCECVPDEADKEDSGSHPTHRQEAWWRWR